MTTNLEKKVAPSNGAAAEESPGSRMAQLRAAHRAVRSDDRLELPVPGYPDGMLGVRYHPMPREEWIKMADRDEDDLMADVDGVIRSCDAILYKGENGYEPIIDKQGEPLRFDARLAEYLDFEAETARQVVHEVFCLDSHPLAVSVHAIELVNWMRGSEVKAGEALLGK